MRVAYILIIFVIKNTILCSRVQRQRFGLDHFAPTSLGCNVNWVLDAGRSCEWCEIIYAHLIEGLTEAYSSSSIYIPMYTKTKENYSLNFDLKGTCFINWLIGTEFRKLSRLLRYHPFSKDREDDWFVFIDVRVDPLLMVEP